MIVHIKTKGQPKLPFDLYKSKMLVDQIKRTKRNIATIAIMKPMTYPIPVLQMTLGIQSKIPLDKL